MVNDLRDFPKDGDVDGRNEGLRMEKNSSRASVLDAEGLLECRRGLAPGLRALLRTESLSTLKGEAMRGKRETRMGLGASRIGSIMMMMGFVNERG
jgi:hypothetical protein